MSEIFTTNDSQKNDSKTSNKTILLIAIAVILIAGLAVAAFMYLNLPKHGDQVNAPTGLDEAVNQHFKEKLSERGISKITYHYCTSTKFGDNIYPIETYVALVEMYPKPIEQRQLDKVDLEQYLQVFAREKEGKWDVSYLSDIRRILSKNAKTHPCER
jgi:hypothetical protein